jgi:hypothetical protein
MMSQGRPCTYVYTLDQEREGKLIVSFHCRPVAREKAIDFRLVLGSNPVDIPTITEIQFAGSTEGHQVLEQY